MRCAIWYRLYNFKNLKNTHGGVLLLLKLQAKATLLHGCFSCFFKLCKWYQIVQSITYVMFLHNVFEELQSRMSMLFNQVALTTEIILCQNLE